MNDLVEFIRAQLDEDERVARAAGWHRYIWELGIVYGTVIATGNRKTVAHGCQEYDADHIARHDPARALREVDAKRRILELHAPEKRRGLWQKATQTYDVDVVCPTCVWTGDDEDAGGNRRRYREHAEAPCETLCLLALPYAARPGYREEWAP